MTFEGGMTEIDQGMNGWNNDPSTPISYVRQGTTNSTGGLTTSDTINSIVFQVNSVIFTF
jgi:hypothetical protein